MMELINFLRDMSVKERWIFLAEFICVLLFCVMLWAGSWIGCALIDSCYYSYVGIEEVSNAKIN